MDKKIRKETLWDQPITHPEEDRFDHALTAKNISKAILDKRNSGANVIAVTGPWGAGKSGILSLLKREIQGKSAPKSGEGVFRASVVQFEPWMVGSRPAMIAAFFSQLKQLANEIKAANQRPLEMDEEDWSKATKALEDVFLKFAKAATSAATLLAPSDPTGTTALAAAGGGVALDALKQILDRDETLEKLRADVENALHTVAGKRANFRIVVFIDDLDRLEPLEALEILRLVKAVADFPYITYLLAYDEVVLAKAVKTALQVKDGHRFLEKIVQFSFDVPVAGGRRLSLWAQREIQEAYDAVADYTSQRSSYLFSLWFPRLLSTPRDVKRLLIAMRMLWPSLEGRVDFLDFVWLQLLRLKAAHGDRDLYSWVLHYVEAVEVITDGGRAISPASMEKDLIKILGQIGWRKTGQDKRDALDPHRLEFFLPGIHQGISQGSLKTTVFDFREGQKVQGFIDQKRFGSPRHWRLYSSFQQPENALSDVLVERLFQASKGDYGKFESLVVETINTSSKSHTSISEQLILEQVEPNIASMDFKQVSSWAMLIFRRSKDLIEVDTASRSMDPWNDFFKKALVRNLALMLKALPSKERPILFDKALKDGANPWVVGRLIAREHSIRSDPGKSNDERVFDTKSDWDIVRKISIDFFRQMQPKALANGVAAYPKERSLHAITVFVAWDLIDDTEVIRQWVEEFLKKNLAEQIKFFVNYSYSDRAIPHLRVGDLERFMDTSKIKKRLGNLANKKGKNAETARNLQSMWGYLIRIKS